MRARVKNECCGEVRSQYYHTDDFIGDMKSEEIINVEVHPDHPGWFIRCGADSYNYHPDWIEILEDE